MKTENVYYLEDKANIGDYVISPSDTIGRNGGEPYGIVPVSTNYFIENAEYICLNFPRKDTQYLEHP